MKPHAAPMPQVGLDQITIVLQGNFNAETARIVAHLQALAPTAPIVLSCWESNRAEVAQTHLPGVTTIFSQDPGAPFIEGFKGDNIRRQIVSSRCGIEKVRTPWVVKIRSDVSIDPRLLQELTSLCTRLPDDPASLFSHKVVATSLTTLDGVRSGLYFHVCDWLYLGRTDDVRAIFSAPLPDGDFFTYFRHTQPAPEICSRYRSESYLLYHLVRAKLGIEYLYSGYLDPELAAISEQILKVNFVIVNPWNLGLTSSKHRKLYLWMRPGCYSELNCGGLFELIGPVRSAVAIGRDLATRCISVLAAAVIKLRNRVRAWRA
ncbi:WavE lipopolysaccharide synthesis family protein [Limnohabitans sp. Rim47]|uniref:WavE lipopolysaccharide synthesis family protein n=1 Tax=Limnohabitans sp. Rim47 TaxID=1100721 RepID=UPI000308F098|nr:WavE lipopolysaccharide synthesis family protein [Limnohabitans sp. Rim47]